MFTSTLNKGFHMTFKNGLTISVQWGRGNYCDNRSLAEGAHIEGMEDIKFKSENAEVAIWNERNEDVISDFIPDVQDCKGFLEPNKVAELIYLVSIA